MGHVSFMTIFATYKNKKSIMESKYITVAYKLYATLDGKKEVVEEAPVEHPFQFISGLGYTLPMFEEKILSLNPGEEFTLTIPSDEAYGPYREEAVQKHPKTLFCDDNGKFDTENIFVGNVIPLRDGEGHQFLATINDITETEVELDFNHPHAGKDLLFEGKVVEMRIATPEEIQGMLNMMSGEEGGCGCGSGCGCGDESNNSSSGCGGGCCGCH